MPQVLNMPGLGIQQGCEYATATQGAEYALKMPRYAHIHACMYNPALIILNMLEYACIYLNKQSSEYTDAVQC